MAAFSTIEADRRWMRRALTLAGRASGDTTPNPMVGAVVVRDGICLGEGWHRRAGQPHAEVEALNDVAERGAEPAGATLYVTLEPCSTHGRTPPCTNAILAAGIRRVVVAATDPNPRHEGRGLEILRAKGVAVDAGLMAEEAGWLNRGFNRWIVHRRPWVTLKAAMTLDGKIATASGESKWITGAPARRAAMRLRRAADAILVGVNTVIADDPLLTVRLASRPEQPRRRIILDPRGRTPEGSRVLADEHASATTLVVTDQAPANLASLLTTRASILVAPRRDDGIDLAWLMEHLGRQEVGHLLVEGGGATHGAFLDAGLVDGVAFFYAPLVLGGRQARRATAGKGAASLEGALRLDGLRWRKLGADLFMEAAVARRPGLE